MKQEKEPKKNSMDWYRVIAYSGIPLFGLLYLLLSSRRNKNPAIREYAGAAFKYRLTMFGIAVITLTVGVLDTRVKVPDVRGLTLEDAADTLNQAGIFYQVIYKESDENTNIVLNQSIRAGKVIDNTESITLTVSVSNDQSESSSPIVDDDSDSTTDDTNTDDEVSDKLN